MLLKSIKHETSLFYKITPESHKIEIENLATLVNQQRFTEEVFVVL